jgi:hypothetical protein
VITIRILSCVLTIAQIISITCDNTSNNDIMIDALSDLLTVFPGASNQTQCFDHIVNLIAKSIIRQFDINQSNQSASFDKALQELIRLADILDLKELETRERERCVGDDADDDNADGWVDEHKKMSETEQDKLEKDIQPVRQVLMKVSLVFCLISPACVDVDDKPL